MVPRISNRLSIKLTDSSNKVPLPNNKLGLNPRRPYSLYINPTVVALTLVYSYPSIIHILYLISHIQLYLLFLIHISIHILYLISLAIYIHPYPTLIHPRCYRLPIPSLGLRSGLPSRSESYSSLLSYITPRCTLMLYSHLSLVPSSILSFSPF